MGRELPIDQLLLLLMVGVSCVSVIINIWRSRLADSRPTFLTALVVLGVAAAALFWWPTQAGTISVVIWLILLMIPVLLVRLVTRAVLSQNFRRARRMVTLLRWLQPFGPWASYIQLMRAQEAFSNGDQRTAEQLLANYHATTPFGRMVVVQLYRMQQRWPELLTLTQAALAAPAFGRHSSDLNLLGSHLRALGHNGELNQLVDTFTRYQPLLHKAPWLIDQARLFVYAFCGRLAALDLLLQQQSLAGLPAAQRRYWRAIGACAAGQNAVAQAELSRLVIEGDQLTQSAAKAQLERLTAAMPPALAADILTPETQQQLVTIEREHSRAIEAGIHQVQRTGQPWITYGLLFVNIVLFAVEWLAGAPQALETLYDMGAMMPIAVLAGGEWWRLVSSTFLHFSIMHLTFNMLALWYLGRAVEAKLGAVRYLLLYLLAGALSMAMYVVLLWLNWTNPYTLVAGASGSIMGLVGAEAAILLHLWRMDHSAAARRRFFATALIVVTQASLDLFFPEFSFVGHLSGTIFGFLLALLLYRRHVS